MHGSQILAEISKKHAEYSDKEDQQPNRKLHELKEALKNVAASNKNIKNQDSVERRMEEGKRDFQIKTRSVKNKRNSSTQQAIQAINTAQVKVQSTMSGEWAVNEEEQKLSAPETSSKKATNYQTARSRVFSASMTKQQVTSPIGKLKADTGILAFLKG